MSRERHAHSSRSAPREVRTRVGDNDLLRPELEHNVLYEAGMKSTFPHRYVVSVDRVGPAVATLEAPPRPALIGGPPPEFQGDPHVWSPEHLLAAAIGLCLFTTFEALAARDKLEVLGYRDVVTAVLDRTSSGLAFKSFTICVEFTVDQADLERARALLERAEKLCIISKALQVPVKVEPHIWSHTQREHTSCAS